MNRNKIFCKGNLCKKSERKYKCIDCKVWVCGICSVPEGKKIFCINCYLKSFSPNWDKLNKEFDEMLINLKLKKEKDKHIVNV